MSRNNSKGNRRNRGNNHKRTDIQMSYKETVYTDQSDFDEGRVKKTWNIHDLKTTHPLTENQRLAMECWFSGSNIYQHGCAGTGKSYIAMYLALNEVLNKRADKIIIIRSVVPSRSIGFTPGTIEDKLLPYETPYINIASSLIGRKSTYKDMKKAGIVEFAATSFLRSITFDDCVIILDESQNLNQVEFDTVMTRVGNNTRLIICGDGKRQNDLSTQRGAGSTYFHESVRISEKMSSIDCIEYQPIDIVRSGFCREWIETSFNS